jgi:hypothetical protein
MAINGAQRVAWTLYYKEKWATTYEAWFTDETGIKTCSKNLKTD